VRIALYFLVFPFFAITAQAQPPVNMKNHRKLIDSSRNYSSMNIKTPPEICDNNEDDDGNGLTDMKDFACYFNSGKKDTCIQSKILWATLSYGLYRVDMETNADTTMSFPLAESYYDISWTPDGKLYGAEAWSGNIYEIDPNTAQTKFVSTVPGHHFTNGMCSDAESNLYLTSHTTYYSGTWHVVKLNPITGKSSIIADLSQKGLEAGGDLAFLNGYLYVSCLDNKLAKIDVVTGNVTVIKFIGGGNGMGLITLGDGYLYISAGEKINRIDTETWISTPYYTLPSYGWIYGLAIYSEYCDASRCRGAKAKINVKSALPFCSDLGVLLEGAGSGMVGGSEFIWSFPDGRSVSKLGVDTLKVFTSGKYYLTYKSLTEDCSRQDSIEISINNHPSALLGNDTVICAGNTLNIQPLEIDRSCSYLWQDGTTTAEYSITQEGIYFVKVTNEFGCSALDSIVVINKTVPSFSLGKDTSICEHFASLLLRPVPAVEGYYSWNTGALSESLAVTESGYYQLEVNNFGCLASAGIFVGTKPNAFVSLGNDTTLCEGTGITLDAFYDEATYTWQDGTTFSEFNVQKSGTYSVIVDLNGCKVRDEIVISYLDEPRFTLGRDTVICQGNEIILQPKLNAPVNYLWQDGSTQPYFATKDSGYYILKVHNDCGTYADEIKVSVDNCNLLLPNAFTPNGDGLNDVFKIIYPFKASAFRLLIFNRFGEKIFETNDMNRGWDGWFKGEPQPAGVYAWVIQITEKEKLPKVQKGTVSLIR
jgi:gliding motility-associated-like protein